MTSTRLRVHPRYTNLVAPLARDGLRTVTAEVGEPELWIYDYIDAWADPEWGGVSARMVVDALAAVGPVPALSVRLSSPGGDYFEGVAIYNALVRHAAHVTVHVDALAASAASVIAMAGDRVIMGQGAQIMIHEARTFEYGCAEDFRATALMLDQTNDDIAGFYATRSGTGDATTWREAVRKETWYTAQAAVDAGLADEIAAAPSRAGAVAAALGRPARPEPAQVDPSAAVAAGVSSGEQPIVKPRCDSDEIADCSCGAGAPQNPANEAAPEPVAALPTAASPAPPAPEPPPAPFDPELLRSAIREATR